MVGEEQRSNTLKSLKISVRRPILVRGTICSISLDRTTDPGLYMNLDTEKETQLLE